MQKTRQNRAFKGRICTFVHSCKSVQKKYGLNPLIYNCKCPICTNAHLFLPSIGARKKIYKGIVSRGTQLFIYHHVTPKILTNGQGGRRGRLPRPPPLERCPDVPTYNRTTAHRLRSPPFGGAGDGSETVRFGEVNQTANVCICY